MMIFINCIITHNQIIFKCLTKLDLSLSYLSLRPLLAVSLEKYPRKEAILLLPHHKCLQLTSTQLPNKKIKSQIRSKVSLNQLIFLNKVHLNLKSQFSQFPIKMRKKVLKQIIIFRLITRKSKHKNK